MKIFDRNRVSNITASATILFTLYAVVFQAVPTESLAILTGISGFSAKHLFDSVNNKKEE
jgi:hypothetical protein